MARRGVMLVAEVVDDDDEGGDERHEEHTVEYTQKRLDLTLKYALSFFGQSCWPVRINNFLAHQARIAGGHCA